MKVKALAKLTLGFVSVLGISIFQIPSAHAIPPDSGRDPYRQVTCYVKDSRGVEYRATGLYGDIDWVQRKAFRRCYDASERPSTCRLLRCRR